MRCPGRDLLTNDNIISIFQACFRIGHYQTERSKDMSGMLLSDCTVSDLELKSDRKASRPVDGIPHKAASSF